MLPSDSEQNTDNEKLESDVSVAEIKLRPKTNDTLNETNTTNEILERYFKQHSSNESTAKKQIIIDDYKSEMVLNFHKFRNENLFTDIFIYVEGVEFPCHKVVLCAASCYFKAMFSCDLKESRLGKVFIENISPWTMKRLLDFIYTGNYIDNSVIRLLTPKLAYTRCNQLI